MRKSMTLLAAIFAVKLLAGGLWLQVGSPDSSPEARSKGAILTVKAVGCHDPENTKVSAQAVGMLNGKRQTVPLEIIKLPEPGTFALTGKPPKTGKWVIELLGENKGVYTYAVIPVGPGGPDRKAARTAMGRPDAAVLDAVLLATK